VMGGSTVVQFVADSGPPKRARSQPLATFILPVKGTSSIHEHRFRGQSHIHMWAAGFASPVTRNDDGRLLCCRFSYVSLAPAGLGLPFVVQ
jgi:hypothetical protein